MQKTTEVNLFFVARVQPLHGIAKPIFFLKSKRFWYLEGCHKGCSFRIATTLGLGQVVVDPKMGRQPILFG